jgi:hypothetical protein
MSEAAIGFIGVIIGALLAPGIDWFRSWRSAKKNARYLAIRVICILDEFVGKCVEVVGDDGDRDNEGYYNYNSKLPTIDSFPENLEWKSIHHKMMYRILILPSKIKDAFNHIDFACDHYISPPYDDLGPERQYEFAVLGLYAATLALDLRKSYGMPFEEKSQNNPDWDVFKYLRDKKEKIEASRKKSDEASVKLFGELN